MTDDAEPVSATNNPSPTVIGRRNPGDAPARPVGRAECLDLRIQQGRLSFTHPAFKGEGSDAIVRRFLEAAFSLSEVRAVDICRERGHVAIELTPLADPAQVWPRLGGMLRNHFVADDSRLVRGIATISLAPPEPGAKIHIGKVGQSLAVFRGKEITPSVLRISNPLLRRRDVQYRLRENLRWVHGVHDIRSNRLFGSATVFYDPGVIDTDTLLHQLNLAWPSLIDGPSPQRVPYKFFIGGGLLGLCATATFAYPALLPWATVAVILYSLPNVYNAARELAKGKVGLYAMFTARLALLMVTQLPLVLSLNVTLTQMWTHLARGLARNAERSLFAGQRRRFVLARVRDPNTGTINVGVDQLPPDAMIVSEAGEYIPVDGVIVDGLAAIDEYVLTGVRSLVNKSTGDTVYAGTQVSDGHIAVRTIKKGGATASAALAASLPYRLVADLPSTEEAQRIGDRNARFALAAAGVALAVTGTPPLSQAIIRPDYATAPWLSSHLSALTAIADGLPQGVLLRNPSALDILPTADIFVFDDGVDFDRKHLTVARIVAPDALQAREALALAVAAFAGHDTARADALNQAALSLGVSHVPIGCRSTRAGAVRIRDKAGRHFTVATHAFARQHGFTHLPSFLPSQLAGGTADADLAPVVVAHDRTVVGVILFNRRGRGIVSDTVAALRARNKQARFLHLSSSRQDLAEARTAHLGLDAVFGGADPLAKATALRNLSQRAIWIGKGSDPSGALARQASAVSISVDGLGHLGEDQADIVLLRSDPLAILTADTLSRQHAARLKADYRAINTANVAGLAGALLAGFGTMEVSLLSHVGTAAVYFSRKSALERGPYRAPSHHARSTA